MIIDFANIPVLPTWAILMIVITFLGALVSIFTRNSTAFGNAITLDFLIGLAVFLLRLFS